MLPREVLDTDQTASSTSFGPKPFAQTFLSQHLGVLQQFEQGSRKEPYIPNFHQNEWF